MLWKHSVLVLLLAFAKSLRFPSLASILRTQKLYLSSEAEPEIGRRPYAGGDACGFSASFRPIHPGFQLSTQVVFGSNALEHGINLLEERTRKILVVSGWNAARVDPIMWELEPRGFIVKNAVVPSEPSPADVLSIVESALSCGAGAVIAMGGGSVLDASKAAVRLLQHPRGEPLPRDLAAIYGSELQALGPNAPAASGSKEQKVLLVTIPNLPCSGAELSPTVALLSSPAVAAGAAQRSETQARAAPPGARLAFKSYIKGATPDLCFVQPQLVASATMNLVSDRILALMGKAIDLILGDTGFLPELLAWDALSILVALFDEAVDSSAARLTMWKEDAEAFEELTVNDVTGDHRSQYFRRYGHGLSNSSVHALSRAGAALATASVGVPIGGLQLVVDTISSSCLARGVDVGPDHSSKTSLLLPRYVIALHQWSAEPHAAQTRSGSSPGRPDRDAESLRLFVRSQLEQIHAVFQTSRHLRRVGGDADLTSTMEKLEQYMPYVVGVVDPSLPERLLPDLEVLPEDCYAFRVLCSSLSPSSPVGKLPVEALAALISGGACRAGQSAAAARVVAARRDSDAPSMPCDASSHRPVWMDVALDEIGRGRGEYPRGFYGHKYSDDDDATLRDLLGDEFAQEDEDDDDDDDEGEEWSGEGGGEEVERNAGDTSHGPLRSRDLSEESGTAAAADAPSQEPPRNDADARRRALLEEIAAVLQTMSKSGAQVRVVGDGENLDLEVRS